jgi:hypothetical protein
MYVQNTTYIKKKKTSVEAKYYHTKKQMGILKRHKGRPYRSIGQEPQSTTRCNVYQSSRRHAFVTTYQYI